MKTNKEFGDYVFEKAEKYKAKRAATIKRIASGIAGCLAFAVVVTLMGINGIFNVGNLNYEKEEPKVRMYSIDGHVSPQSEQNQPVAIRNNDVISYGMEKEIYGGGLYFYIKTYNALENEYTVLHSADDFFKYSAFISNMKAESFCDPDDLPDVQRQNLPHGGDRHGRPADGLSRREAAGGHRQGKLPQGHSGERSGGHGRRKLPHPREACPEAEGGYAGNQRRRV